ncbi:hypothetical protein SAMN05444722_1719 [Rhodovulum sp. ES.010]|nr:hypothetical protein SAMN05444722_1719 [Rhodovulum sp. ES.010]
MGDRRAPAWLRRLRRWLSAPPRCMRCGRADMPLFTPPDGGPGGLCRDCLDRMEG